MTFFSYPAAPPHDMTFFSYPAGDIKNHSCLEFNRGRRLASNGSKVDLSFLTSLLALVTMAVLGGTPLKKSVPPKNPTWDVGNKTDCLATWSTGGSNSLCERHKYIPFYCCYTFIVFIYHSFISKNVWFALLVYSRKWHINFKINCGR